MYMLSETSKQLKSKHRTNLTRKNWGFTANKWGVLNISTVNLVFYGDCPYVLSMFLFCMKVFSPENSCKIRVPGFGSLLYNPDFRTQSSKMKVQAAVLAPMRVLTVCNQTWWHW